jgi:hypothetical protein
MKYLVMVHCTQADYDAMAGRGSDRSPAWSEAEMKAMFSFMEELNDELTRTGELVDAQGLAAPATARSVALDAQGETVVTDGPYGETTELMAGFWVLECESLERVTELAARINRCPEPAGSPSYPVVIRPVQDGPDLPG